MTLLIAARYLGWSVSRLRLAALLLASAALAAACGGPDRLQGSDSAERAVLDRRRQGMEALIDAARRGTLLPFDKLLVVVDEGLVRQVLRAGLPVERVIAGRFRVRVTGAEVTFADGFGLVQLDGVASFADRTEEEARAVVTVFGGLDVVDLDPESGTLRGQVKVIAVDVRRVDVMGVRPPMVESLVEELGRERLEAFSALASGIEIPVQLERSVSLPAVERSDVRIEEAVVPLRAAVADVKAFRGKLWVSVDVSIEPLPQDGTAPSGVRP
ncbi:MAG TPA: hypothetical protein VMR21_15475 [Vicinamibacteria bacterium]|nr:hypothetical protein [Vicinamibacteria bacterium]